MRNLTNPAWIKVKGALLLLLGLLASTLILLQRPSLQGGVLLVIAIWAFCRFYYFVFYVIEHYVDPTYRFTGLLSFVRYLIGRHNTREVS
ncbi:MAG TPA: hypothetical protein VIX37_20590 [Candidatus Sulfotelmatobacter sp.]